MLLDQLMKIFSQCGTYRLEQREMLRNFIEAQAIKIQAKFRGFRQRKRFLDDRHEMRRLNKGALRI